MVEEEAREDATGDAREEAEAKWPPKYLGVVALYVYFALRVLERKVYPLSR